MRPRSLRAGRRLRKPLVRVQFSPRAPAKAWPNPVRRAAADREMGVQLPSPSPSVRRQARRKLKCCGRRKTNVQQFKLSFSSKRAKAFGNPESRGCDWSVENLASFHVEVPFRLEVADQKVHP